MRNAAARWLILGCAVLLFATGCARVSPASSPSTASAPSTGAPRTLRFALQGFEEPNRDGVIGYGSAAGFDPLEHYLLFHAPLTVYDPQATLIPRLAEKVPSLQDGDWQTFPDGHMEVTWRLRPSATWHDGAPLLAEDFAFGYQVVSDVDVPVSRPSWTRLISEVRTPEPHTLVVVWREPSFLAGGNGASDVPAIARYARPAPTGNVCSTYGTSSSMTSDSNCGAGVE